MAILASAAFILLGAMNLAAGQPIPSAKIDPALRDAVELSTRGGLPNVFRKLKTGGPVKVAYLGGSITEQKGWRAQSREWLQKKYPDAQVTEINAAIGGTGSDLGVFRVENDVLRGKPDLLFVEFAVNDSGASPERIAKAMEGIVRKTWRVLPETDICFVYTLTAKDSAALAAGKMKQSESIMEAVADHYQIPSIHFGLEVARLEKEGKLVMSSADTSVTRVSGAELDAPAAMPVDSQGRILFSKDGVHPLAETGQKLYTQALVRSLEKMEKAGAPGAHFLGAPLTSDHWELAQQISLDRIELQKDKASKLDPASDVAKLFANRLPGIWKFEPGATLKFKFKGTKASVYELLGPDGAKLSITVDGVSREAMSFDAYCTYHRLGTLNVADKLEDTVHEVSITVLPEAPDKASILFAKNRADLEKKPAKYAATNWYAGAVFIVGEIVE